MAKWQQRVDKGIRLEILREIDCATNRRMSGAPNADAEGLVSKVQVKKEIKTIVENLETILGDLKDVAKELKEVNEQEATHEQ